MHFFSWCSEVMMFSQCQSSSVLRHQMRTRPFMRVILAILTKRLDLFVAESDLQKMERDACGDQSYAQQQEFASLCNALGDRILSVDPSIRTVLLLFVTCVHSTVRRHVSCGNVVPLSLQNQMVQTRVFKS